MQAETAETSETSETVPLRGISEATAAEILAFRDDRRWLPYHNPKDLAMSVAIEAGELLEVFQWSGTDLERGEKRGELADELADVLIYAVMLADRAGLSMDEIVRAKLAKSAARYPRRQGEGARERVLRALQGRSQEGGPLSYLRDFAMRPMSPPTIIRKMKGPARFSRPSAMAAKVMKKPIMMQAEPMKPSGTPRLRA